MNFEQIKTSKPFKIFDLFLYCFVLILVIVLFSVFVFFPANANLVNAGFKVILHDKQIFTFNYDTHTCSLLPDYTDFINIEDLGEGFYNIKIFTDQNKTQYNLLTVNSKNKTVRIADANCSISKDCAHMKEMKESNDLLICAPHKLKVLPLNIGYKPPVTGE